MLVNSLLKKFSNLRLLVVGDVMLDSYWHGSTSRISPEAPVPVVNIENIEYRLGGAGNVALNCASLGAKVSILGLVGEDKEASLVNNLLSAGNVEGKLHRIKGSKTITKLRVISRHQQLIRLDFEDHFPNWNKDKLLTDFISELSVVGAVILSDYSKGALRSCKELIQAARSAGKPVIVDPKGTDFERYRGATLITPNLSEFEAVVGRCVTDADIEFRGAALRDELDLEAVLVTRSEKGMTLLERGNQALHLPTQAKEVFDVTGAGDTVVSALAVAIAAGLSLKDAVHISNAAAGIVVAKLGTATVSLAELENELCK